MASASWPSGQEERLELGTRNRGPLFVDGTVGPSQDFHLRNDSPAIGAGTSDAKTGASDLDGKPRPAAGQSEPSLGAYEPTGDTLTVMRSGSGGGSGSVSGSGISCPGTCSKVYAPGTTVTLTAAPGSGSVFSGWSGACSGTGTCQVTMSSEHTVTATFTRPPPPALSHVRLGSSAFTANKGTTLTLTLSEAATINVLVTRARHGRKVKGRCRQGAKHGQRCTLTVQKAKLAFRGRSGSDRFKLLIRNLAPGRYTATITARAKDGKTSKPVKLSFTIKKPNKK